MYKLKHEIKNEIAKIYSGKLAIAVLICVVLFCSFSLFNQMSSQYSDDWKKEIQEEIKLNEEITAELGDELDEETFENQLINNIRLRYYLDNNISPNTKVLEFVHDSIDVNFVLILLSVLVFAKVFCIEKSSGTEKIYLARSIKRGTLVASKLISAAIITTAIYVASLVISFVLGFIFFGKNGIGLDTIVFDVAGTARTENYIPVIFNAIIINILLVFFLTTMTSLIAVIIKKQLFAVMIPFLIWNFGGSLVDATIFIPQKYQFLFFAYPLNYFGSIGTSEIVWNSKETIMMTLSITLYSVLMLFITIFIFTMRSTCGGKLTYKNKSSKE